MALKRKAATDVTSPSKRHHKIDFHSDDPIYEEVHSNADYSASGTPSIVSHDMNDTPATPFSTTSARYPSELKTHRCPFEGCDKAFNRPARLQEHIRSHNNERLFPCTYDGCEKTFLRTSHLNHHIKSAHTGVRDYLCDRCGKSFVTGSRLRRHIAAHEGQDKYRCTEYAPCEETFRKHSTLQKHIMTVHLNQKPFPCTHVDEVTSQRCQVAFDTAGHLRSHENRVHSEKRFSCAECTERLEEQMSTMDGLDNAAVQSVTFPTYALLQDHLRTVHPPKCPQCPIICSTSRELRRHLEVAHGDVSLEERKVFECTYPDCDRSFTKKGNLTVHIRTVHEGEKRFGCGDTDLSTSKKVTGWDGIGCGKRYGSKLALEEHVRTTHLGFQNAKAERRQRLGLDKKKPKDAGTSNKMSTLAALTGHGYAEETGRHIACLYDSCENRFHRDYDLWVHMTTKHGCAEDEVQGLFMQRALLGDQTGRNSLGIYGLEFDDVNMGLENGSHAGPGASSAFSSQNDQYFNSPSGPGSDFMMQDVFLADSNQNPDAMASNHNELASIDPVLAYHMMEE
ncbi:uncharacterized protein N7483_010041 [Penicillium malachiteum]|uniref:uncharacterized protein n=1 Tax=Penicillium malachiteum TaxID=1324776 RepID=UPI0025473C3A|nr:uncharacterized protein N7483_010041 [Penicillium malachiteum]KAJ5712860.1 hypothetical protein N7483_010041 [Penicillium malachiteum]